MNYTYLSLHHEVSLKSHLTHKSKHINTVFLAYPLQHNIKGNKSSCATNTRTAKTTNKTSLKATGNSYGSHYVHYDLSFLSTSGTMKRDSLKFFSDQRLGKLMKLNQKTLKKSVNG